MRILNEEDKEITAEEVNLDLGYLKPDKIFIQHHEEIEAQEEKWHYAVSCFYFEDGSFEKIEDENDPRVVVIDKDKGLFSYDPSGDSEERALKGIDLKQITDQERVEGKEAWDEYEDIQRYILYTEEELQQRKKEEEKTQAQELFLQTGPERLDTAEVSIEDLSVAVADMFINMTSL